ncbi:MAG: hypothetical protein EOP88_07665 [Verrucomicrobiaceae bacterium]|nr:MAG: hypothetical protein EOP88_07665 [Verrucomicrobiaceae bacterium]
MAGQEEHEKFWTVDRRRVAMMMAGPLLPVLPALYVMWLGRPVPLILIAAVVIVGPAVGLVAALRLLFSWWVPVGTKGLAFSCIILNGGILYLLTAWAMM